MVMISGQDIKCLNRETLSVLIFAEPLIAYYLMRSRVIEDAELPACAGITVENKAIKLYLNPNEFGELTRSQQLGVLIHEYLHVLFLHVTKRRQSDAVDSEWHRMTWNWGLDLSINQLIVKHYDLPKNTLMPDGKMFEFPNGLSAEKYVRLCREKYPLKIVKVSMGGEGEGKGQQGKGGEGEGSGKGQGDDSEGEGNGEGEEQGSNGIKGFDDHSKWADSTSEDEGTSGTIIKDIAESYVRSKMGTEPGSVLRGSSHGGILEELLAIEVGAVDWRREVKKFIYSVTENAKKIDYKKYSRRLGFPSPGKKRKKKCHLKIIWDTSGSMVTEFLQKIAGELNLISKVASLDVYQCDTQVTHKVQNFKPSKNFVAKGRGGTILQPAFTQAFEDGADGIICFTDGYIDRVDTFGVDTLWVIVNNERFEPPSGRAVHVKW